MRNWGFLLFSLLFPFWTSHAIERAIVSIIHLSTSVQRNFLIFECWCALVTYYCSEPQFWFTYFLNRVKLSSLSTANNLILVFSLDLMKLGFELFDVSSFMQEKDLFDAHLPSSSASFIVAGNFWPKVSGKNKTKIPTTVPSVPYINDGKGSQISA